MGAEDEMRNKGEELRGKAKETTGRATGNEQWQAEGKSQQVKANLKQAAGKFVDAFRRLSHRR